MSVINEHVLVIPLISLCIQILETEMMYLVASPEIKTSRIKTNSVVVILAD